ncbi:MAG: hypothetical protein PW792_09045 [Acidobacteriaceae bacterium]|nr:hypothetical protein [Acidobacteriaceae bacterium]
MKISYSASRIALVAFAITGLSHLASPLMFAQTEKSTSESAPPKQWTDADTGHKVIRLSDEPGSKGLYFNLNAFTADGKAMIYSSPKGLHRVDLITFETTTLIEGKTTAVVLSPNGQHLYFKKFGDSHLYVLDIESKQIKRIADLPIRGVLTTVNANETLLAGTVLEGDAPDFNSFKLQALREAHDELLASKTARNSELKTNTVAMQKRLDAHLPEDIFTVNIATGK